MIKSTQYAPWHESDDEDELPLMSDQEISSAAKNVKKAMEQGRFKVAGDIVPIKRGPLEEEPAHAPLGSVPPAAQHAPLQIDPLASAGAGPALPKVQFKVQGTYNYPNKSEPTWLNTRMETPTLEMAQQIAALYPKALGVTGRPLHTRDAAGNSVVKGVVGMNAKLGSDKNIGEVNEAGLKRYQRFLKTADKLGHHIGIESTSMGVGIRNAYSTLDEFHKAIGLPPYSPPQE